MTEELKNEVVKIEPTMRELIKSETLEDAINEITQASYNGNNCIDIPMWKTIIGVLELIKHAKELGMKVCILIHTSETVTNVNKLIVAGVDDFLLQFRAEDKDISEKATKIMNAISKEIKFRVLIKVTRDNYSEMEQLATKLLNWDITIVNFEMALWPGEENQNTENVGITFEERDRISSALQNSVNILESKGIGVNIYNLPMCWVEEEYRRCICNEYQLPVDPYSYANGLLPKTVMNYAKSAIERGMECAVEECAECSLFYCCGIYSTKEFGTPLIKPVKGLVEPDSMYYRKFNILTMVNPYPKKLPCLPGVREVTEAPSHGSEEVSVHVQSSCYGSIKYVENLPVENLKAVGLPDDFGPKHPWWGIPSKMNRYKRATTISQANDPEGK